MAASHLPRCPPAVTAGVHSASASSTTPLRLHPRDCEGADREADRALARSCQAGVGPPPNEGGMPAHKGSAMPPAETATPPTRTPRVKVNARRADRDRSPGTDSDGESPPAPTADHGAASSYFVSGTSRHPLTQQATCGRWRSIGGIGTVRPVLDHLDLLQRDQPLLDNLVDVGEQRLDLLLRIDDLNHDRQFL